MLPSTPLLFEPPVGPLVTVQRLAAGGWLAAAGPSTFWLPPSAGGLGFEAEATGDFGWHLWATRWAADGPLRCVYVREVRGEWELARLIEVLGGPR